MTIKSEVEKHFQNSIENYSDQEIIKSFGPFSFEYFLDIDSGFEGIRGSIEDKNSFCFYFKLDHNRYLKDDVSGEFTRDVFMKSFIKNMKAKIDKQNKDYVFEMIKKTIKNMHDQEFIRAYGLLYDNPINGDRGLFFSGGEYPTFWGREMNTNSFIKSKEYRNKYINNVILSIVAHFEAHDIC